MTARREKKMSKQRDAKLKSLTECGQESQGCSLKQGESCKDKGRFNLRILTATPLVAEDDLVAPPVQNGDVHAGADGQQVLLDPRPHLFF